MGPSVRNSQPTVADLVIMRMMHRGGGAWQPKERRMKRAGQFLVASGVFFFAASAFGQVSTTGTTSAPSVADQTPTENLTTAGARGPSTIVSAARARHLALRKNRLA